MKIIKKFMYSLITAGLCFSTCTSALAMETNKAGITITPVSENDKNSVYGQAYQEAGYKATFTYVDTTDKQIEYVKVFGNLQYFTQEDIAAFASSNFDKNNPDNLKPKSTYEYRHGMISAANNMPLDSKFVTDVGGAFIHYQLSKISDKTYSIEMPIAPDGYHYKYAIKYVGEEVLLTEDPANLSPVNPNNGNNGGWSYFLVGNKNNSAPEQEYIYPVESETKKGTISYTSLTANNGNRQDIGIYLPANYDTSKTYKVIYASHGSGGNETEWFSLGGVANIMDNLIDENLIKDTIVVTMNNNKPFNNLSSSDDLEAAARNIADVLVPYMEQNYNASTKIEDRAVIGLSAGGSMSTVLLNTIPEKFKYIAISSVGRDFEINNPNIKDKVVSFYCGNLDWRLLNTRDTLAKPTSNITSFSNFTAFNGAHDWSLWRAAFQDFAKNVVWSQEKNDSITPVVPDDKLPVEESVNSVKTGDDVNLAVLTAIASVSLIALIILNYKKRVN